ncbi:hypothetical protein [Spongiactinospora sp. TRM90649]|uniref:hypothetical protein n=1 Tax=Spongiactinospora sp. TRM90649 TaxID=3031114 RepID=UPI0023F67D88|nr:hypothetical protein [Spongiactinospora sp. TRM90649]MDF5752717.1 hypothetical protein [Spongiactinospora sp. TRM90649]
MAGAAGGGGLDDPERISGGDGLPPAHRSLDGEVGGAQPTLVGDRDDASPADRPGEPDDAGAGGSDGLAGIGA